MGLNSRKIGGFLLMFLTGIWCLTSFSLINHFFQVYAVFDTIASNTDQLLMSLETLTSIIRTS